MALAVELIFFGGDDRGLFGCYHAPLPPARECAFVLCPPHGHEDIQFHRVLRQLAVLLAEAGFGVLRFDPSGCGDSVGDSDDWGLARWQDDVGSAMDELRQRSGVHRVGLIGLRLGASVAMAAAARSDVDSLVLWDPVISGADYLSELRGLHQGMLAHAHVTPAPVDRAAAHGGASTGEELLGYPMPGQLSAELSSLDLLASTERPARQALLVESNKAAAQGDLVRHLGKLDVAVQHEPVSNPHLWVWNEDFAKVHVPRKILELITAWASEVYP